MHAQVEEAQELYKQVGGKKIYNKKRDPGDPRVAQAEGNLLNHKRATD